LSQLQNIPRGNKKNEEKNDIEILRNWYRKAYHNRNAGGAGHDEVLRLTDQDKTKLWETQEDVKLAWRRKWAIGGQ